MCNLSVNITGPVAPESVTVQLGGLTAEINTSASVREGETQGVTSGFIGLRPGSEQKIYF